jgi:hypothetical protein
MTTRPRGCPGRLRNSPPAERARGELGAAGFAALAQRAVIGTTANARLAAKCVRSDGCEAGPFCVREGSLTGHRSASGHLATSAS